MSTETARIVAPQQSRDRSVPGRRRIRSAAGAYLIVAPGIALLGLFVVFPILSGMWMSLHKFDGVNPMEWLGAGNYAAILRDPVFLGSVIHTVIFAAIVVVGKNVLGFGIAALINRRFHGVKLVRTLLFLPVTLNILVVGSFWSFALALENGLVNNVLRFAHLDGLAQAWLSNPAFALPTVALVEVWRWLPLHVLIYLAGLQELPPEIDEAAHIDGAGTMRRLFQVTLPMLKPIIFVNIMLSLTGAFVRSFELVWVLTKGTAGTDVVLTSMYTEAFQYGRFGRAAAMGVLLFLLTAVIAFLYTRLSRGGRDD
ncbi:MAG: sugar ABC transporter permease [Microbacterium sp.]